MGATVSPIVRGAALLPVEGRRASQSPAVRKRGSADGSGTNRIFSPSKHGSADGAASSPLPGSPMLGSRPLAGNASRAAGQLAPLQGGPGQPIYRMSGAATGALSGGAGSNVSSILKSNSKEAGSRSVKAPGMRSIAFKDAAKTTFVFDRGEDDDLLDDDYYSDDEGGKSFVVGNVNSRLRLHSLVPTGRLDSMADGGLDLAAGLSSRAGSVALLAKKVRKIEGSEGKQNIVRIRPWRWVCLLESSEGKAGRAGHAREEGVQAQRNARHRRECLSKCLGLIAGCKLATLFGRAGWTPSSPAAPRAAPLPPTRSRCWCRRGTSAARTAPPVR